MKGFVVYCHTCLVNGKSYIGWTSKGMEKRWRKHVSIARSGSQYHFHRAINKYGVDAWKHQQLEETDSLSEAKAFEQRWIKRCRSADPDFGYNGSKGGESGLPTVETRRKLSLSQRRRYQDPNERAKVGRRAKVPISIETRVKLRDSKLGPNNPQYGKISKRCRRVDCYTMDDVFVAAYSSIRVAARTNDYCEGHIGAVCRGTRPHHQNLKWRFAQ